MKCTIKMIWDDDTCRWHCESEEVPGFLLESNSFDGLIERVRIGLPDFLIESGFRGDLQVSFESERMDSLSVAAG